MTPEETDKLTELETKFESLLSATNDVDLISAYVMYKQEIHQTFLRIGEKLEGVQDKIAFVKGFS